MHSSWRGVGCAPLSAVVVPLAVAAGLARREVAAMGAAVLPMRRTPLRRCLQFEMTCELCAQTYDITEEVLQLV